jgi:hypothetical protein
MTKFVSGLTLLLIAGLLAGRPDPNSVRSGGSGSSSGRPIAQKVVVIADLTADFVAATTIGQTARGPWNYYVGDVLDPAAWKLTPLTWGETWRMNDPGRNPGYVADNPTHLGAVTGPNPAVKGQAAPAKGVCAIHPGPRNCPTVAEWTSTVTNADVTVSGAVKMVEFAGQSGVQFWAWKKGADGALTDLVKVMTIRDNDSHAYSATTTLAPGDKIHFVLGPNGEFWCDHTHVAATIAAGQ